MSCRCRVFEVPVRLMAALLRGEARVRNLPADARIEATCAVRNGQGLGVRVSSQQFAPVPFGTPLPVVVANVELLVREFDEVAA